MRSYCMSAFLSLLLFCASSACAQCNPALRIGFITGLSGEGKVWGDAVKNGFELGLSEAGCASMKRVYEDDQFAPAKSVSAFRKLVEQDKVNAVVVTSSADGNAVAPLAQQQGIALFAWASDTNVSKGRSMVVRTWISGEKEGEYIAQLSRELGHRRFAAFSSIHDYPQSVWMGISNVLPDGGAVPPRELPLDMKDFKTEIIAARARKPDSVYLCLMVPGASGIFARQMKELGMNVPIFGCEALELNNFGFSAGALVGAWYVTGGVRPEFESRYKAAYGEPGTLPGAAIHYDLARSLASTQAHGGSALVEEVLGRQWESNAMQQIVSFKDAGDQALLVKLAANHYSADGKIEPGAKQQSAP